MYEFVLLDKHDYHMHVNMVYLYFLPEVVMEFNTF
jgi:hypothetical protein